MRFALLIAIAAMLFARPAYAVDPECESPPPSDQTMWDGAGGELAYCTSLSTLSTVEVLFDGEIYDAGTLTEMTPPGTLVKFSVADRFGVATFMVATIAVSGEPVPVVMGTVTFQAHLPPVLLAN